MKTDAFVCVQNGAFPHQGNKTAHATDRVFDLDFPDSLSRMGFHFLQEFPFLRNDLFQCGLEIRVGSGRVEARMPWRGCSGGVALYIVSWRAGKATGVARNTCKSRLVARNGSLLHGAIISLEGGLEYGWPAGYSSMLLLLEGPIDQET
jgi:hypothetical protein